MALSLTIENETSLPDGGPLSVSVTGKRGLDIGRDRHLDWTLPDPTRYISGKHCEIRYRDGGYWLHDVSTNGTYLNGSDKRMQAPHRLRNGDRLAIGHYLIAVGLEKEQEEAPAQPVRTVEAPSYQALWDATEDAAPPVDPAHLRAPAEAPAPLRPDFLDWAADLPEGASYRPERETPRLPRVADEDIWAEGPARTQPAPEPPPPTPSPRRPVWVGSAPSEPWAAPAAEPAARDAEPQAAEPAPPPPPLTSPPPASTPFAEPPAAPSAPIDPALAADFVARLAHGAGVPADFFARRDAGELAEELGALMRLVTQNVRQLLQGRLQAKRLARSTSQTMVQALDNNPLKFSPTDEDALRIMFGPRTRSYLDACAALEQGFGDLKTHQLRTFAAMQQALRRLASDLDPAEIESATQPDRGISAVVGSRKARLWDLYVTRWQAKTRGQQGGLVDAFMDYFAESYDGGGEDMK